MNEDSDEHDLDITLGLAASPNFMEDGLCFAGKSSGLYRSSNRGTSWEFAYESLNLSGVLAATAVAISPDFAADHTLFAGAPGGILRSADAGRRWNVLMLPPPPPVVTSIGVSPEFGRDGVVLLGSREDGVFRSADKGSHWVSWNFGLVDLHVNAMAISSDFEQDETLYVGTETGIFRSTNAGRAWREVEFPRTHAPVISLALSPNFTNDGILFAGTEENGLFRSRDQGHTWDRLAEGPIDNAVIQIIMAPNYATDPAVLVLLPMALLISRDDGLSWTDWRTDLFLRGGASAVAAPLGLDPDSTLLLGLNERGVLSV